MKRIFFIILLICSCTLTSAEEGSAANSNAQEEQLIMALPKKVSVEDSAAAKVDDVSKEIEKKQEEIQSSPAPYNIEEKTATYESAFLKMILVLVSILILVGLTFWMFKKMSNSRYKQMNHLKSIKVLERRPLSPKSMLYLLDVGGKQVLIAESQLHVEKITTLDWLSEEESD